MAEKRYIEVTEAAQYADVFFADPLLKIATASFLATAPTSNVVEPIVAHWEELGCKWVCSHCRARMCIDGTPEENNIYYCPSCGARMGGGGHGSD